MDNKTDRLKSEKNNLPEIILLVFVKMKAK